MSGAQRRAAPPTRVRRAARARQNATTLAAHSAINGLVVEASVVPAAEVARACQGRPSGSLVALSAAHSGSQTVFLSLSIHCSSPAVLLFSVAHRAINWRRAGLTRSPGAFLCPRCTAALRTSTWDDAPGDLGRSNAQGYPSGGVQSAAGASWLRSAVRNGLGAFGRPLSLYAARLRINCRRARVNAT